MLPIGPKLLHNFYLCFAFAEAPSGYDNILRATAAASANVDAMEAMLRQLTFKENGNASKGVQGKRWETLLGCTVRYTSNYD